MKRTQFLWNLLVGLAVIVILAGGIRLNSMRTQTARDAHAASQTHMGTDPQLNKVIEFLESNLAAREAFRFKVANAPMLLSNVVIVSGDLASLQRQNVIRVTAIVGASQATALVQYEGKSYKLGIGDTLAGGRVIDVQPEHVTMQFKTRRVNFPVLGLSMSPEEAAKYRVE